MKPNLTPSENLFQKQTKSRIEMSVCLHLRVTLQMATSYHKHVQLPIYRVKTIMKSSPQVENISNESIHLVAKATELFIQYLAQESLLWSEDQRELQYKDIALLVDRDQRLEFLRELIPQKITVKEYKDLLKKENEISQLIGL